MTSIRYTITLADMLFTPLQPTYHHTTAVCALMSAKPSTALLIIENCKISLEIYLEIATGSP